MVTEDSKEACRARVQALLDWYKAELEAAGDKSYLRESLLKNIDANQAILDELDGTAAWGTASLRSMATGDEANRSVIEANRDVIRHRAAIEAYFERQSVSAERQAAAFERIAELLAKQ